MKKSMQVILLGLVSIITIFIIVQTFSHQEKEQIDYGLDGQIYGITIDDSWYDSIEVDDIVLAIEDMPVKPTVRIVMSRDINPKDYIELFQKLHQVAYVMACPVDSSEMKDYKDVAAYQERFEDSFQYLSSYTDIWEIGNEVNGTDWIEQENALIANKITAAYDSISSAGGKTALTFYYEKPGHQPSVFDWIEENIPGQLRQDLDYSFISYYEDDNDGYQPEWQSVFDQFQGLFPDSKVGIGECGNTAADATVESKEAMAAAYYSMPRYTDDYVGGYFWWNWVQDCLPHQRNRIYKAINQQLK